jgi:hypothetical protein
VYFGVDGSKSGAGNGADSGERVMKIGEKVDAALRWFFVGTGVCFSVAMMMAVMAR